MKPTLIIFDCDGVLGDTEQIAGAMFSGFARAAGYNADHETCLRTFRGRSMKTAIEIIEADIGRPLAEGWGEDVTRQERAIFDAHVDAIPHIHTVTDAVAAAGLPSCVASSSVMGHIETVLRHIGLTDHFSGNLYSATMVVHGKPAPDLFLHAAREMGHAPEVCVVIEDSLPGVQAGVAAGMKVFGYVGDPMTDREALAAAGAQVFDDMRDLSGLIGI